MPDTYITLADLNKLFQSVTLQILGFTQDQIDTWKAWKEAGGTEQEPLNPFYFVRVSWPTGGAPAFKISEDVTFIRVFETDSYYNKQKDIVYTPQDTDNANQATSGTRVLTVSWIFYGPNSFDNAQKLKLKLLQQDIHDILANNKIYIILDLQSVIRAPELFQGQWWERSDLSISFNNQVIQNTEVPYIKEIPVNVSNGDLVTQQSITQAEDLQYTLVTDNRGILTT